MDDNYEYIAFRNGEDCYFPVPIATSLPGLTSFVRMIATRDGMMPTQLIPMEEGVARLERLEPDGNVNRQRVEKYFIRFIESLKIYDPVPPVEWFDGPDNFAAKLYDRNIWYRDNHKFTKRLAEWEQKIAFSKGSWLGQASRVPLFLRTFQEHAPIGMTSRYINANLYSDNNYLRAIEAGLGYWIVAKDLIVLFPRPIMKFFDEGPDRSRVLHSTLGPAIAYPNQPEANQYWFRGVRVPEFVITNPERITLAHIRGARTPKMRNAMIDRYGLLRYAQQRGFEPINKDEKNGVILWARGGKPYSNGWGGGISQRRCILEMINTTPEPDGNHRHTARRVPGRMQTAREAVAWTFGLREAEYTLAKQT